MTESNESSVLLTRKTLHEGRVIRFDLERVALPGGHVTELEIVHHPGAACIVPFVAADELLLLRQFRHAAGGFILELPAGTLRPGEEPSACAVRELEEETGFRAGALELLGSILTTPGFSDERIHLYEATELEPGRQAVEDTEILTVERVGFDEAFAMIADGRIQDAKSICALGLARLRRERG